MNHLQHETSPYLLQHAENPVEWYPWGAAALQKARDENKPILLSIGYSACHWCHVMAHESFEHAETAEIMNRLYVNIKVDREERPDLDDIYMQSVQQLTGQGGWPMTVFLLPDGRPFYGGTYYPREARYGMPAFRQILEAVHDAYTKRRPDVESAAAQLTDSLQRDMLNIGGRDDELNADLLDAAFAKLRQGYDKQHGGFGTQPKFPQPMNLEFLLRIHARTGSTDALDMATHTLRTMARGGIYDQIGGGFHRYSVDQIWLVPHFEKMLYDNAQLSRVYLHAGQITGDSFFRRIAEEIYDYVLREMTAPDGGFYSTTDADSEGEEGKFFVWSKAELQDLLGDDAPIAIEYFGVSTRGNFEEHTNILNVPNDDEIAAQRLNLRVEVLRERLTAIKDKLFAVRSQRIAPGLDDKIVTAWNGMMLASLAEAARVLERADYRAAALRSAEFLRDALIADGRPRRTYKDGRAKINGYLEDYANLIDGFIQVYQLTFDPAWFALARSLADTALARFRAPDGGFFDTSDDHEALIARPRSLEDNAVPSGTSMLTKTLTLLAAYTGEDAYAAAARAGLRQLVSAMREYPQAFGEALNAVDLLARGVSEIALVGDPAADATKLLLRTVNGAYRPNSVIALSPMDVPDEFAIPLLSYRTQRGGQPTAYVCRNFACQMPVTTADALRAQLP